MPKAFVMVDVYPGKEADSQGEILRLPGVQFAYQVTGSHDLIAFVDLDPYEKLAEVVASIRKLQSVRATDTELVLK